MRNPSTGPETTALSEPTDPYRTRSSLLYRVRDWSHSKDWEEFYARYTEMILSMGLRRGLSHSDAQDIAQEVFKRVAVQISTFRYDPSKGQFRSWLCCIADRLLITHFQRVRRRGVESTDDLEPLVNSLTNLNDSSAESEEENYRLSLINLAEEEVRSSINPLHFQVYHLLAHQGWTAARVADVCNMSVAKVYVQKFRVLQKVKHQVHKLERNMKGSRSTVTISGSTNHDLRSEATALCR